MGILSRLSIILIGFLLSYNCLAKENNVSKVFGLIKQKKWEDSYSLASKTGDSALKKIVLSQQYLDSKHVGNSFEKIVGFLKQNPHWPQNYFLKLRAESLLNSDTNKKLIVDWFSKSDPVTGKGRKYYALAAASIIKDPKKLSSIIKASWHHGNFSKSDQQSYYKQFRKYLSASDHVKKIDNHLWNEEITAANNSLNYVNAGYKKSFAAQIAFIQKKKDAQALFKRVPKKYYTSGLIYRYLWSRRNDLPSSAEIVGLFKIASIDKDKADSFWKVQAYIAREFIERKKYRDAYKVASSHFASNASAKSDAECLSGWLALNFLQQPDLAIKHFRIFNTVVRTPISKSRGIYWLARAYDAKRDAEKSQKLYYLGATKYPYTFYGQMAAVELKQKKIILPNEINLAKNDKNIDEYIKNNEVTRAAQIVSAYGTNGLSRVYIDAAVKQANKTSDIVGVAKAISQSKNIHHITWAAKSAMQKHVLIKNHAFPTPYQIKNLHVESPLTYSIIRQESVFDQNAISSAEARGLMQLIKPTACDTAKLIGVSCRISSLTTDPLYNITLGSRYINQMIETYDGSYILAIASYNGGPHNVNKWIKTYGDPRSMKSHRDVLNWLEQIPFHETRNYVQRVLENLQIYREILEKDNKFRLSDDLLKIKKV
jgi:soluble lytic murein transglycosylase